MTQLQVNATPNGLVLNILTWVEIKYISRVVLTFIWGSQFQLLYQEVW